MLLGEVDGCPFYIDAALDQAWTRELVLDVAAGDPEGFSLGAGPGCTSSPVRPVFQLAGGAGSAAPMRANLAGSG